MGDREGGGVLPGAEGNSIKLRGRAVRWRPVEAAYLLGVGLWWAGSWGMGAGGRAGVGVAVGWRVACRTASSKSSIHLLLAGTERN